jgi:hypothetical protein
MIIPGVDPSDPTRWLAQLIGLAKRPGSFK